MFTHLKRMLDLFAMRRVACRRSNQFVQRRLAFEVCEPRLLMTTIAWIAPTEFGEADVDGDGNVAPLDALMIINRLNSDGPGPLPAGVEDPANPQPHYDVNQDGFITSADADEVFRLLDFHAGPLPDICPPIGFPLWYRIPSGSSCPGALPLISSDIPTPVPATESVDEDDPALPGEDSTDAALRAYTESAPTTLAESSLGDDLASLLAQDQTTTRKKSF